MESMCFNDFTISVNGSAYESFMAPNKIPIKKYFQHVIQLASISTHFANIT